MISFHTYNLAVKLQPWQKQQVEWSATHLTTFWFQLWSQVEDYPYIFLHHFSSPGFLQSRRESIRFPIYYFPQYLLVAQSWQEALFSISGTLSECVTHVSLFQLILIWEMLKWEEGQTSPPSTFVLCSYITDCFPGCFLIC